MAKAKAVVTEENKIPLKDWGSMNKSEVVRTLIAQGITKTPLIVAEAKKHDIDLSLGTVQSVKHNLNKQNGTVKGRKSSTESKAPDIAQMADFMAFVKKEGASTVATLLDGPLLQKIEEIGGIEVAKKLVALLN